MKQTRASSDEREFFLIALAHIIANGAGNFAFGPEIYRTKAKHDYDVKAHFRRHVSRMLADLASVQQRGLAGIHSTVHGADARTLAGISGKIGARPLRHRLIQMKKDYTRTTRVESLILGLMSDPPNLCAR
jgi:hypothetical protein